MILVDFADFLVGTMARKYSKFGWKFKNGKLENQWEGKGYLTLKWKGTNQS